MDCDYGRVYTNPRDSLFVGLFEELKILFKYYLIDTVWPDRKRDYRREGNDIEHMRCIMSAIFVFELDDSNIRLHINKLFNLKPE